MLSRRLKIILGLYLGSMLLLHLLLAWNVRRLLRDGRSDFKIFYTAGRMVREGRGSQLYDEATQLRVQEEFLPGRIAAQGLLPYNHPPFEALLFVPFSFLPYGGAFLAWNVVNVTILLGLPRLLRPHVLLLRQVNTPTFLFASLAFFPIFIALIQGQDILLLLLVFTLAFIALKKNSDFVAGCWLGLGLFRFHLLVPMLVALVWQRRGRALYGFLAVGGALAALSVLVVGWRETIAYPAEVLHMESSMSQRGTIGPLNMPNLHGLSADLPFSGTGRVVANGFAVVIAVGMVVFLAARWEQIRLTAPSLGFSLCLLATVLTAYHGFAYDLSLLILVIVIVGDLLLARQPNRENTLALSLPPLLLAFSPLQMLLWFREDRFGLVAIILLFWFWAIARVSYDVADDRVSTP
jgi:hypothetical protein